MNESPTPADRAFRALADAIDDARPRSAADGVDPSVPVAATLVLARDSAAGPEVLVIERPDRGSFAGAWVFPGGKLEEVDAAPDAAEEDDARRAAVRETREETGLTVHPDSLTTLSCWDPPPGLALRIRTWFFVARAPAEVLTLAPDEAVASRWARPADLIAEHGRGALTLYPPTWVTLYGLVDHADVDDVLAATRLGGMRRFETVARRGGDGPMLLWQDDAEYDPAAVQASVARHRLEIGALPWRYLHAPAAEG